ncbi:hypothetical protein EBO34_16415 [Alteribacter keqinensis]|uniref:Uncharacterized protein n=1 Tax=Alteribacter keqinensis TaxID=2483800 RepID=A0A3M7TR14_9BACI|nr:hypothetical protein EBO34_16415 [Alteribacter keqinensis]
MTGMSFAFRGDAGEPPQASPCGVLPWPPLPQESSDIPVTFVFYAKKSHWSGLQAGAGVYTSFYKIKGGTFQGKSRFKEMKQAFRPTFSKHSLDKIAKDCTFVGV